MFKSDERLDGKTETSPEAKPLKEFGFSPKMVKLYECSDRSALCTTLVLAVSLSLETWLDPGLKIGEVVKEGWYWSFSQWKLTFKNKLCS